MPLRKNLREGSNGLILSFLRKNGGTAQINFKEFSSDKSSKGHKIQSALSFLILSGLIRKVSDGKPGPCGYGPTVTLNECAIKAYEDGTNLAGSGNRPLTVRAGRRNRPFGGTPDEVQNLLEKLTAHKFQNKVLFEPLFNTSSNLCKTFAIQKTLLEKKEAETDKLKEALLGFGMKEGEITEAINITPEEVARNVEYQELPAVPTVDFAKLLDEPARIFKSLAVLQSKTRTLRNILIEVERETSRLDLAQKKLLVLLKEKQEAEKNAVDISACFGDWQRRSDRYFRGITTGVAVVSSRE